MHLTLWLLNRCVGWLDADNRALVTALESAGHHVFAGQRRFVSNGDKYASVVNRVTGMAPYECENGAPGELMHEGWRQRHDDDIDPKSPLSKFDEYFVPIPVKCVGNPWSDQPRQEFSDFWETVLDPNARDRFRQIVAGQSAAGEPLNPCFTKENIGAYWTDGVRGEDLEKVGESWPFADVRMNTEYGIGLYQILWRQFHDHGRKNVLVGYSQGGAVARYLAFIDEYLVAPQHRCIHGIVAVNAPLRGSPLAMADNEEYVLGSLLAAILAITPLIESDGAYRESKLFQLLAAHMPPALAWTDVRAVTRFLDAAMTDLVDRSRVGAKAKTRDAGLLEALRAARKWLSGLSGESRLAFWDLDSGSLDTPGRVLHDIATSPVQNIWHGSVVGTQYELAPFVSELAWSRSAALGVLELVFRSWVRERLRETVQILRADAMDVSAGGHHTSPLSSEFSALASDYQSGVKGPSRKVWGTDGDVPALAHDFVIPSVSQLMVPGATRFLGNSVNPDASHLSGADSDAGRGSSFARTLEQLRKMSA